MTATLLSLLALGALWTAAALGWLPALLPAFVSLASLVTLGLYALDKSAAVRGRHRVAESTLHLWSLAGGWPGALAGRALLRHKTRKQPFRSIFLATLVANLVLLAAFGLPPGDEFAWRADAVAREWLRSSFKLLDKTKRMP
ncbi:MAG: DUF1294 domain-containing protein [Gammaproteobacteria bacterium]|nr:DUF1294 domain-containing protein [Gammaproteobacteria bacterium]